MNAEIKSGRLENSPYCKMCGSPNDGYTAVDNGGEEDDRPKEGSLSVCLYCSSIGKFDKDMNIVPLEKEELEYVMTNYPDLYLKLKFLQEMSRRIMEEKGSKPN